MTPRQKRAGFTLIEIIIVSAIMALTTAVAVPRLRSLVDRIDAQAASHDAAVMITNARHLSMTRRMRTSVEIDDSHARLVLRAGIDTIQTRDEGFEHGVRFRSTGSGVFFAPLGMAYGVSNLTLIVSKGTVAETVTVSRLGRVRE